MNCDNTVFQDICSGIGQIVMAFAESHTAILISNILCTEEAPRMQAFNLVQMILVGVPI